MIAAATNNNNNRTIKIKNLESKKEKQQYGYSRQQIKVITHKMTRMELRKGNFKKEAETLNSSTK